MPVIVLEGVDGSGKSTLAENIRAAGGKRYFTMLRHSCRPYSLEDVRKFHNWVSKVGPMDLIIDRHPLISEPIYGPILRGKSLVEELSESMIFEMLSATIDKVVYCRPPRITIEKCLDAQPQLAGVKEKIDRLLAAYDAYFDSLEAHTTNIKVIEHNWTRDSTTNLLKELFDEAS